MKLVIMSPFTKKKFDVAWIELNTPVGNFIIQPGHAPTLLALSPHKEIVFCLSSGKQESYVIKQGIIDITRTGATLLLNEEL
jgi:F0F1-type ATP synthase epsilon subunit